MQIRDYSLPNGWYPRDKASVSAFLSKFKGDFSASAAIAPHAGWYYSGHLAALAVSSLSADAQVIVVLGGHLPGNSPPLFAMEDAVKTPFGSILIDDQFRSALYKELGGEEDRYRDNTVEVLLPMVHYFFPDSKLLWIRFPADISAYKAGAELDKVANELGRKISVIGSTDLTHYGSNYGFSPKGSGAAALDWVKNTNDAAFINAVLANDPKEVLRLAAKDHSSCSAGAVVGAMGFINSIGGKTATLLEYDTSASAMNGEIPESFVGYAAISWV